MFTDSESSVHVMYQGHDRFSDMDIDLDSLPEPTKSLVRQQIQIIDNALDTAQFLIFTVKGTTHEPIRFK